MRFEKRELKPYAEPVSVEKLNNGQKLAWRLKFVALLDLFQARKVRFTADQLCAGKSAQQVGLALHHTSETASTVPFQDGDTIR